MLRTAEKERSDREEPRREKPESDRAGQKRANMQDKQWVENKNLMPMFLANAAKCGNDRAGRARFSTATNGRREAGCKVRAKRSQAARCELSAATRPEHWCKLNGWRLQDASYPPLLDRSIGAS